MKVFAQNRTAAFDKRAVIKCAVAVALLVAASKVSFAIGPVPLTMQTFAVAVVGDARRMALIGLPRLYNVKSFHA